jgi:hypothetical protein
LPTNLDKVHIMTTITNDKAKHQYSLDVINKGVRETLEVDANTRYQAVKLAHALGYTVNSVNMIG